MPTVRKSAIVAHACDTLFALVDRVEDYPRFLPWCAASRVIERDDDITVGRIDIDFHGLASHIVTRNAKRPPAGMSLTLVEGPFESFAGEWRFEPLGSEGCRVELSVQYVLSNRMLDAAMGPVFGHILETLVDRFVARADEVAEGGPRA
jgi:ribosome-associated toxin RatA of RatAB toxin-antitoxin module